MKAYQTTFIGIPVTVNYEPEDGVTIVSVEWRGIELQDAMTDLEMMCLYGELSANLQADLVDAADYAKQAMTEELMQRRAA